MEEREICAHRRICVCVCVYSRKMRSGNSSRFIVVPEYPRAARCFNSLAVSNNIRYFYRYRVYLLAKRKREGERELDRAHIARGLAQGLWSGEKHVLVLGSRDIGPIGPRIFPSIARARGVARLLIALRG